MKNIKKIIGFGIVFLFIVTTILLLRSPTESIDLFPAESSCCKAKMFMTCDQHPKYSYEEPCKQTEGCSIKVFRCKTSMSCNECGKTEMFFPEHDCIKEHSKCPTHTVTVCKFQRTKN